MIANPLALFLIIATPVAFVVMVILWRRSRTMAVDPWYGESTVVCAPGESVWSPAPLRESPEQVSDPHPDREVNGLDLCKKVLFCWDYWSSGKSGLDLQDIFEARNLPAELRGVLEDLDTLPRDAPRPDVRRERLRFRTFP